MIAPRLVRSSSTTPMPVSSSGRAAALYPANQGSIPCAGTSLGDMKVVLPPGSDPGCQRFNPAVPCQFQPPHHALARDGD